MLYYLDMLKHFAFIIPDTLPVDPLADGPFDCYLTIKKIQQGENFSKATKAPESESEL